MSRMPHELHVDAQLTQVAWVRQLALAVARDASEADDLAQDAWLAALSRKPSADQPLGGWFRRVLQNLARLRRRGDARRGARERSAARPERDDEGSARHAGDPLVALERLETQEMLLRAVRELDEPFRTTIVLHWLEGLAPAQIATRVNAPLRTVQARLARGLALLRERLDRDVRRDGGRSPWLSAWLPLLTRTDTPWPWILIMDAKLKLALAGTAVVGALAAVLFVLPERGPRAGVRLTSEPTPEVALQGSAPEIAPLAADGRSQAAPSAPVSAPRPAPAAVEVSAEIEGLVIDVSGAAISGVEIDYASVLSAGNAPRARSDTRGSFHLPGSSAFETMRVVSPQWINLLTPRISAPPAASYTLVVAPRIELEGLVTDEQSTPIPNAKLDLECGDVRGRLQRVLDNAAMGTWKAESDAAGHFHLNDAPGVGGSRLRVSALGFQTLQVDAGADARFDMRVVLRRNEDARLRGQVVDASGAPVAQAYVALGSASTQCDAEGRFELTIDRRLDEFIDGRSGKPLPPTIGDARVLRAIKQGFLPAELTCTGTDVHEPSAWPDPLVLRLSSPALAIRGRVVNGDGTPIEHAAVWLLDRSDFGWVQQRIGAAEVTMAAEMETLMSGERYAGDLFSGADGSFEVRGLRARSYRLRVIDRRTLRALVTEPIAAGAKEVEIVLPAAERIARIAGRVVDRRGRAVEGVRVTAELGRLTPKLEDLGELSSIAVTTDAEGRFELRDLSRAAERLFVQPRGALQGRSVVLAELPDLEEVEVRIASTCHLQVDLAGSGIDAREFRVLDAQGETLQVAAHQGDLSYAMTRVGLNEGRSQALMCSDAATTLVLLRDDVEVKRIPLALVPGELNVIRP